MNGRQLVILRLALLAIVASPCFAQSFDFESPMANPTAVPPEVLRRLAEHEDVREYLDGRGIALAEVSQSFEAAQVNINNDSFGDLVVRNLRLNGANIGPFWVFVGTRGGYRLVFFTRSLGLSVLKKRRGYRDLRAGSATADELMETVYRFNGQDYKPRRCTRTDLDTRRSTKIRCAGEETNG